MDLLMDNEKTDKNQVIKALKKLRVKVGMSESEIQRSVAGVLRDEGILFEKEKTLSSGNRIDFLISGGIGIEIKRGKPNSHGVHVQLQRYLVHKDVNEIILISERYINLPPSVNGKACTVFNLNRLWGIAI